MKCGSYGGHKKMRSGNDCQNKERPPIAAIKYLFNGENRIDGSHPKWIHCFNPRLAGLGKPLRFSHAAHSHSMENHEH